MPTGSDIEAVYQGLKAHWRERQVVLPTYGIRDMENDAAFREHFQLKALRVAADLISRGLTSVAAAAWIASHPHGDLTSYEARAALDLVNGKLGSA